VSFRTPFHDNIIMPFFGQHVRYRHHSLCFLGCVISHGILSGEAASVTSDAECMLQSAIQVSSQSHDRQYSGASLGGNNGTAAAIASGASSLEDRVVRSINSQFRNDQPGNEINNAGVVVRAFDMPMRESPSLHKNYDLSQARVFAFVLISLACTVPLLLSVFYIKDRPQAYSLLLAFLSCIYFGIENFIIADAAEYLQQPSAHMAMAFFFEAALAFLIHVLLTQWSPTYKSAWQTTVSSPWRNLAFVIFAGIYIGLAQLCANLGFAIDPAASGPNQALVCLDVLIVGPFFSWHSGETVTNMQIAAFGLMIVGAAVLSDIGYWYSHHMKIPAFLWLILSMLFYAASIICWRLASEGKDAIPWQPRLVLIYGIVGIMGVLPFLANLHTGLIGFEEYVDAPILLAWPFLNALVSILGMWSVNLALDRPAVATSIVTAIVDSSSVVMLLMNMAASHLMPSTTKTVGMCTILFAGVCLCFAELMQG
jgi:hypothetical protein